MGSRSLKSERFKRVVELISFQKPDYLLVTGDFLIGHIFDQNSEQNLQELINLFSPLTKSIPSFAVLGNHDYWTNPHAVREMLHSSGIIDLTNSAFPVTRGDANLYLCGVDDIWEGDVRLNDVIEELKDARIVCGYGKYRPGIS